MNTPLTNYCVLLSQNLDEVREKVTNAYCSHSLVLKSSTGRLNTKHHRVVLGDISINYLQYGADVKIDSVEFERFFMFEIPLSGTANIYYGNDHVISNQNVGCVVSATKPVHSQWSADAMRLMVQLDRSVTERSVSNFLGHPLNKPLDFKLEFDLSSGIGAGLRNYIEYLVNQLNTNNYFDKYVLVRRQVERTILTMLLGQENNYSEEMKAVELPGAPKHIERAYEYIMEHYEEDIGIEDLAEISGISTRSLFAGFKRYKGVTPMLALKTRRLEVAKEKIINAASSDTVTSIAYSMGFTHLGNFARDYHKMFGEKPSDTFRRHR